MIVISKTVPNAGAVTLTGDAVVGNVLSGKTFYSDDPNSKETGTMPNKAGDNACISSSYATGTLKLVAPEGYYDGSDDTVTTTEAIPDLIGSLTLTGTYHTSTYVTDAGCRMGCNDAGDVFITIQGGSSTSYENVYFNPTATLPSGVSLLNINTLYYASNTVGGYFTAILSGCTGKINVSINFSAINATYDHVQADITATYA